MAIMFDECPGARDKKVVVDFSELDNFETEVGRLVRTALEGEGKADQTPAFPKDSTDRIRSGLRKVEQRGVIAHDFAVDGRVAPFNRAGLARAAYVSLGLFSAFFLLPAWFAPAVIALGLLVGVASYLVLGGAKVHAMVRAWLAALRAQEADRSRRMRRWKVALLSRVEALLNRLPASWTQGLYLPDAEPEETPHEKMAIDPFDRLREMASNG